MSSPVSVCEESRAPLVSPCDHPCEPLWQRLRSSRWRLSDLCPRRCGEASGPVFSCGFPTAEDWPRAEVLVVAQPTRTKMGRDWTKFD